ncbi:MAG: succinyl-diaminopimelate desuccinylase [Actinomycetes bacterium]|jgi:succinyl-diaminopimelate desuccinylase|nr:MAG: succinyl-diaminopimelate desuccinylase [Actinomycetota bacterium]
MSASSLVDTLVWLVDIPSPTGQEQQIQAAISERFRGKAPVHAVLDSVVIGDPAPGKVLLVGHTDTVPLQGEPGARIEGDRVHGLGATDMKGGLAVMIHVLEDLGTDRVVGVFYAGEEGSLSGNQLAPILDAHPDLVEAEAAIVMEPTNREVHAGCQGVVNARVWFEGEAAHSARPWQGRNAITKAAGFLAEMDARQPELHEIEGLPFKEVISVTRAQGGVANNVIPARFELNVNYRFSPDRTTEEAIEHLRSVCAAADGFEVSDAAPAAYPAVNHPLFERLVVAADTTIAHKQGWTDVAQLAARGVPAINFGPGETALAHKPGESVRIDDLEWAYAALTEVLE